MTFEAHIDYAELAHGDEYEGEFGEMYCPGQSCAIRVYNAEEAYRAKCETWELLMFLDLDDLGIKPGEHVWVEVDY